MQFPFSAIKRLGTGLIAASLVASPVFAADSAIDSGDTAWILTATALVLLMTLPGLALFYAGLVQSKNIVSVLMHHFAIAALMSILWVVAGYSLAFSGDGAWVGDLANSFMSNITLDSASGTIPESVFAAFQMTFAIITPALIIGAYVERMKFAAILLFSAIWLLTVYAPVTHWVWGGGIMAEWGVLDFAGGMALLVTHIAAATASLVWMFIEWLRFGRPSLVGIVTGMVAGLATITPASGFIGVPGGLILGLAGGVACYVAVDLIRVRLKIDDSLDVFAVHGVGGILGSLLVAYLALPAFGGLGLADGVTAGSQFMVQLSSVAITVLWTGIASYVILTVIGAMIGLRVDQQDEIEGLDLSQHGERGYHNG